MSLFDITIQELKRNKELREAGKDICIPSPFKRFGVEWPGIQQAQYYLVSANQKVGKTQISDFLFVYNPIEFIRNSQTNIKIKVFDFNLEMSKGSKIRQAIVHRIFLKTGRIMTTRELDSIYADKVLPDDMLRFVEADREWFDFFLQRVEYIDDIRNGFGIYKYVRAFFEANGKYTYREIETTDDDGNRKVIKVEDRYTPNDPDLFVIIKVDNVNLLTPEKGSTLFDAIGKFSSDYMVKARNRWGAIPVVIQQQSLAKEGNESIKMGRTRATADGLADNKATSKDCNVFMGLYSPFRNSEPAYLKYDITKLKDHYRNFYIDFDRNGNACETSLYFHGAVNFFRELPKADEMTVEKYTRIHEIMKP
jgi:hypothetical protein